MAPFLSWRKAAPANQTHQPYGWAPAPDKAEDCLARLEEKEGDAGKSSEQRGPETGAHVHWGPHLGVCMCACVCDSVQD